jgi:SEC-C motif
MPGRNDPCHCGSGKKFKRCHGGPSTPRPELLGTEIPREVRRHFEEHLAKERQREALEGLGRPIISAEFQGYRFVAAGSRLLYSKGWKTFHDFLFDYIKMTLGHEWGTVEIQKPLNQRHLILRWYHYLCLLQQGHIKGPGIVQETPATGAAAAYLRLAHDLWLLEHNIAIQRKLIGRLKDPNQFPGAHYETFVAACFIRAGFDLEFENEDDRSTTHCEFTATHSKTGRKFSVEAKHREPGDRPDTASGNFRIGRRLSRALRKKANHQRIVFLDINVPNRATDAEMPGYLQRAIAQLRGFERQKPGGRQTPSAYVVMTNNPHEFNLDSADFRSVVVAEGFKIPDFRHDAAFPSIPAAVASREAHRPMFDLLESLREHAHVPSTFDGTMPEFAFEQTRPRLLVGERYLVPDGSGSEVQGVLQSAIVQESQGLAVGVYRLDDGGQIIASTPLTDPELRAYRRLPETFFGVIQPVGKKIEPGDTLGLYDFFFVSCRDTPKENLLNILKDAPDIDALQSLPQGELAKIAAERFARAILRNR